jgi:hypothetical protein
MQLISRQSTVPEKQKSSISYFSEDPRTFQLTGSLTTGMWAGLWEWSKIHLKRSMSNFEIIKK